MPHMILASASSREPVLLEWCDKWLSKRIASHHAEKKKTGSSLHSYFICRSRRKEDWHHERENAQTTCHTHSILHWITGCHRLQRIQGVRHVLVQHTSHSWPQRSVGWLTSYLTEDAPNEQKENRDGKHQCTFWGTKIGKKTDLNVCSRRRLIRICFLADSFELFSFFQKMHRNFPHMRHSFLPKNYFKTRMCFIWGQLFITFLIKLYPHRKRGVHLFSGTSCTRVGRLFCMAELNMHLEFVRTKQGFERNSENDCTCLHLQKLRPYCRWYDRSTSDQTPDAEVIQDITFYMAHVFNDVSWSRLFLLLTFFREFLRVCQESPHLVPCFTLQVDNRYQGIVSDQIALSTTLVGIHIATVSARYSLDFPTPLSWNWSKTRPRFLWSEGQNPKTQRRCLQLLLKLTSGAVQWERWSKPAALTAEHCWCHTCADKWASPSPNGYGAPFSMDTKVLCQHVLSSSGRQQEARF